MSGKELVCQCRRHKRPEFDPEIGKIPWRRAWPPTPVFLPGESQGQRSLEDDSPWGCKESEVTEVTLHTHTHTQNHTLKNLSTNPSRHSMKIASMCVVGGRGRYTGGQTYFSGWRGGDHSLFQATPLGKSSGRGREQGRDWAPSQRTRKHFPAPLTHTHTHTHTHTPFLRGPGNTFLPHLHTHTSGNTFLPHLHTHTHTHTHTLPPSAAAAKSLTSPLSTNPRPASPLTSSRGPC